MMSFSELLTVIIHSNTLWSFMSVYNLKGTLNLVGEQLRGA